MQSVWNSCKVVMQISVALALASSSQVCVLRYAAWFGTAMQQACLRHVVAAMTRSMLQGLTCQCSCCFVAEVDFWAGIVDSRTQANTSKKPFKLSAHLIAKEPGHDMFMLLGRDTRDAITL